MMHYTSGRNGTAQEMRVVSEMLADERGDSPYDVRREVMDMTRDELEAELARLETYVPRMVREWDGPQDGDGGGEKGKRGDDEAGQNAPAGPSE